MQPDQAQFLREVFLGELKQEMDATTHILERVPAEQAGYTPHPTSMKAMDLAWHIASSDNWFLDSIANGEFNFTGDQKMPAGLKTGADIARWYIGETEKNLARVQAMTPAQLLKEIQLGTFKQPAVMYLSFAVRHSVHHRGQLSTYLRPMGQKVPKIYGGSADEPFEMPAEAAQSA